MACSEVGTRALVTVDAARAGHARDTRVLTRPGHAWDTPDTRYSACLGHAVCPVRDTRGRPAITPRAGTVMQQRVGVASLAQSVSKKGKDHARANPQLTPEQL